MPKITMISILASASVLLSACGGSNADIHTASFPIQNVDKASIGTLELKSHTGGGVDITVKVEGLTTGIHAMHFHAIGRCDAPDFKSSGGHFNPAGAAHGQVEGGPHAGDMMNIEVGADGKGTFNVTNEKVNLIVGDTNSLFDADGSALVIHDKADDYISQPSGAAGPRVACAVISAQ